MTCNSCIHLSYSREKEFYCKLTGEKKSQMDTCEHHEYPETIFSGKLSKLPKSEWEAGV